MSDALFDTAQRTKVTAFKPGFRMVVGNPAFRTREQARNYRQLTYTCMANQGTRSPEHISFPEEPCAVGIMANHRFPTCWDGKNLDSANHQDHVAYPMTGSFESGGPCPDTHPVRIPQLMYETVWDTSKFNDRSLWANNKQPFVWSSGDPTGFSTHADYVFGWKDDALQKHMDQHAYVSANTLTSQTNAQAAACAGKVYVEEKFDGCKLKGMPSTTRIVADLFLFRAERAAREQPRSSQHRSVEEVAVSCKGRRESWPRRGLKLRREKSLGDRS